MENEESLERNSEHGSAHSGDNDQDPDEKDTLPVGEAEGEQIDDKQGIERVRKVSFAAEKVVTESQSRESTEDVVEDNSGSKAAQPTDNEPAAGPETEIAPSTGNDELKREGEDEAKEGPEMEKAEEGSEKRLDKEDKKEEEVEKELGKEEGLPQNVPGENEDNEVAELSAWDAGNGLTGRPQEDGLSGTMNTPTLLTDSELETPAGSPVKLDAIMSGAMSSPATVTEFDFESPRQIPYKPEPFRAASLMNWQQPRILTNDDNLDTCLPPLVGSNKRPGVGLHEWSYHRASRYLRNPFYTPMTICPKMCCEPAQWLTTSRYSGPDRKKNTVERRWERKSCLEDRRVSETLRRPNPAVAVPMRARKWKKMTWMDPPGDIEQWKIVAEREKMAKDRQTAQKLGYETLVGNIMYYDIPGAKDLNRSWKHFLDPDPMAWGFPYHKGSLERPGLPHPSPYLVHQMKEQLWKYPRNKLIAHSTPPPSVPTGSSAALN